MSNLAINWASPEHSQARQNEQVHFDLVQPNASHFFTNRDGNTLMKEFEGILTNNPQVKNLDAVVGFLRASGYFSLRPFIDGINKVAF